VQIRYSVVAVLTSSLVASCAFDGRDDGLATGSALAPLVAADASARIEGQYIVVFHDDVAARDLDAAMGRIALHGKASRIEARLDIISGFSARLDAADLDAIRRDPAVAYIEEDQWMSAMAIRPAPGEQDLDRHDHCPIVDDNSFNDNGCSGSGALVYVIDTGIRATHTQFGNRVNVARGFTAISDGRGTADCNGHGTFVASLAAGSGFGMASAATLIPVRVLGCTGSGTNAGVISGVNHVANNCRATERCVANMSLGGAASTALDNAVTAALNRGIVFSVSAGSSNTEVNTSPARVPAAITVGALTDMGYPGTTNSNSIVRASFSSFGPLLDIWASGVSLLGADDAGDTATQTLSGTSMATAYVTGAIAQMLSCRGRLTPAQVEAQLDAKSVKGAIANLLPGTPNQTLCSDFNDADGNACRCP
jgi:aqualysin 1